MSCRWDKNCNRPFARNWLWFVVLLCLGQLQVFSQSVSLTWNPSTDTNAVGYKIYFGGASGVYTNSFGIGTATNVMVYGLTPGATYYFCATTVTASGTESPFSNEATYVIPLNSTNSPGGSQPGNQPPTLDPLGNLTIYQNAGLQTVNLLGISAGSSGSSNVTVSAIASDGGAIISSPTVNYTSSSSSGTLTFAPTGATGTATVTVTVNNGGASNSIVTQQFTVTVLPVTVVSQPPTLDAITNRTIYQNAGLQTINLTGISAGAGGNPTVTIAVITTDNGNIITAPVVNYTNSNSTGTLTFTPVGTGTVMVMVTVNNGGANNNYISREFTVTVLPATVVSQPPTLNAIGNVTIYQNAGLQTVNLTGISAGTGGNPTVTISAASNDGGSVITTPAVNYANASSTGTVTFAPVGTGSATITVTANNGGTSNNIVSQQFTVTVLPVTVVSVSQPPTLNAISNLTVYEGSGLRTVALTGIGSGSGSGGNPTVTVSTVSSDNGKIISQPAVNYSSPNNFGSLTFVPATNALGSATVTVIVNNGAPSNNIAIQKFTVTVAVAPGGNQPPTLSPIANVTLIQGPTPENIALTGITSGAASKKQVFHLTAVSSNPHLIPAAAIRYTGPASTAVLTLRRVAAEVGTAVITVTANNSGKSNNIVEESFVVTVVSNQLPTLDPIANVNLTKNAGGQTITLTGITSGSPTENQVLKITATSSNPRLISAPKIQYSSPANTALLTFKPAANQTGVAILTVTVNDGAWKDNIIRQSFTVTVTPPPATGVTIGQSAAATLTATAHDMGRFSFQVTGVANGKYVVQGTSDLIHWTSLQTNTVPFTFQEAVTNGSSQRFYRALYLQ
jgi:hypothetical protein